MKETDCIETFHGTSDDFAEDLVNGKIKTSMGGGELGQGFYLGTEYYVARAWAMQKYGCDAVVEVRTPEKYFWNFNIKALNRLETIETRAIIRNQCRTRNHLFGCDVVWAPIVGGAEVYCEQHKWESSQGEQFLNGDKVKRVKR